MELIYRYSQCIRSTVDAQRDCDERNWTMFWFSRRIGHEATWNKIWENMTDDERAFNVINPEMVCE